MALSQPQYRTHYQSSGTDPAERICTHYGHEWSESRESAERGFLESQREQLLRILHSKKRESKSAWRILESALIAHAQRSCGPSAKVRAKKRAQKDQFRRTPNFQVGDYVLIGLPEPNIAGKKLYLKWRGPYRVFDTQNNYVFEVENIIDKKETNCSRR